MQRTFEDAFNLLCGEKIGSGIHRDVFECKLRPDLVVKVETDHDQRNFANVLEHQFWADHQHAPAIIKWLAPLEFLSPDGRISLQRRVKIATNDDTMPDKMPGFLTDIKRCNYGWIGTQLVCVDYAWTIPNPQQRLRKAVW